MKLDPNETKYKVSKFCYFKMQSKPGTREHLLYGHGLWGGKLCSAVFIKGASWMNPEVTATPKL